MDIFNFICILTLFLPLILGVYLIYSRLALVSVDKRILNYGNFLVNLLCFLSSGLFLASAFLNDNSVYISKMFFSLNEINITSGILLDKTNIQFLVYSALTYTIVSLFANLYFKKKKQFLFTKQRYYIFLSLIAFNTYLFIISSNLFQSLILWIIQGLIIFIFSYFDLFKSTVNFNIARFTRISMLGDFAFLLGAFLLFKYAFISEGYIESVSLDFNSLNILISYMYGIAEKIEFYISLACFIVAFMSKLFIFPLSCYYSFFANSSNIFYASIITASNSILGLLLFSKLSPYFEFLNVSFHKFAIFFAICSIISALFIIFEKNIKIIFGYIVSAINSIFIALCFVFNNELMFYAYYILNIFILFVIMILFYKDKNNIKSALINKKTGFLLERTHICVFETIPSKIFDLFNFIDEKLFQNIVPVFVKLLSLLSMIFVIKAGKQSKYTRIKSIFIIFALFAIIAIFIAFFGRYNAVFTK